MTDMEDRIRSALEARAVVPVTRTMPPGMRRAIRSRQAGAAFVTLVTAMAFSFVVFELFSTPVGVSRTGEGGPDVEVVHAPRGSDFSESWPDVDPPAPGEWPTVTRGDLRGAYVDLTVGEEASFVVDKTPVDAGRVQEEPWSLVALEQNGTGAIWSEAAPGPCGELFLGSWGDDGGASFCLRSDAMVGTPDLTSTGIVWGVGPITAYAGVVTDRVDHIEIELEGGESRRVQLLDGPHGVTGRSFVVFVPNGADGSLVAYGRSGDVVGREPLCAARLEVPDDTIGACGNGLVGSSSPVVSGP
jgi:hypothetical protein